MSELAGANQQKSRSATFAPKNAVRLRAFALVEALKLEAAKNFGANFQPK
jgi:hypothetical protein